mmetsp:Transcript_20627/g.55095  ORF Transcript_20627/g.55095 Transcript_20627/m.55095 type:complete len:118 (-) Transcript_20627:21-374(-)
MGGGSASTQQQGAAPSAENRSLSAIFDLQRVRYDGCNRYHLPFAAAAGNLRSRRMLWLPSSSSLIRRCLGMAHPVPLRRWVRFSDISACPVAVTVAEIIRQVSMGLPTTRLVTTGHS